MTLEYQRYGRNKNTLVNKTYIESGEYRKKFDSITDSKTVNRVLYSKAKEMLLHRSGTILEDMYWIDKETGNVVACITDQGEEIQSRIEYTQAVRKVIANRNDLIAMHTHPQSMPPSAADFNSVFSNNYALGIVICHDGKVFCITSKEEINERLYVLYIESGINDGMTEYDSQIAALEKLQCNFNIDFWEV